MVLGIVLLEIAQPFPPAQVGLQSDLALTWRQIVGPCYSHSPWTPRRPAAVLTLAASSPIRPSSWVAVCCCASSAH